MTGITSESIVYSFGVGEDIIWDLAVVERFGASVFAFDPTPRSASFIASLDLPSQFQFHPYGVAAFDGNIDLFPPTNPSYVSHSIRPDLMGSVVPISAPVYRLQTIADMLGHQRIDVVKLDIEGSEYQVIADMAVSGLDIRQLVVEFHHNHRGFKVRQTRDAVETLRQMGYRIFAAIPEGSEFTFVRT